MLVYFKIMKNWLITKIYHKYSCFLIISKCGRFYTLRTDYIAAPKKLLKKKKKFLDIKHKIPGVNL